MSAGGRRGGDAAHRSLLMFVQALTERTLVLELRSDLVVRGRLTTVDDEMKCELLWRDVCLRLGHGA
jgi:hypothetical protein